MRFEHPNVLWALLLLAIPIIIHLFHFKRFKTLYFSSLIFIKQTEQETKSVKKLKHLLILISRLLAFIALVLAFAKPYFPTQNQHEIDKTTAIYIDNSFSMTNIGSAGQLFEIAKDQAHKIIQQSPNDESFYIFTNNQSGLEQKKYSKAEALQRIDNLEISPFSRSFIESANWIQTQAEKENGQKIDKFIYLSDFQNEDLSKDLLLNHSIQIYPIQLTAQKNTNLSIDSAWFTNSNFRINAQNELHIIVHNYSDEKVDNLSLSLYTNKTKRDISVQLRANDTAQVVVNYVDTKPDWVEGKISLIDEGITFDDELFFSYQPQIENNVVIINGEDAVENIQQVYKLDAFYKIQVFNATNIDNQALQHANTIILNGLNNFSSGLIERLKSRIADGIGVGIFPGRNPNLTEMNQLLTNIGLSSVSNRNNEKFKINTIHSKDIFFNGVFRKIPNNISLPTLNYHYNINKNGSFLPLLSLENGDPVLVRSTTNNTFLFTGSLNKNDGNFTSDPIFSTSLLRIGEMSRSYKPIYLTIGKNEKYPIIQKQPETAIRLSNKRFEFIPFKSISLGKSWISVNQIPNKGIISGQYQIFENQDNLGVLTLNYNRDESKMKFLPVNQFEQELRAKNYTNIHTSVLSNISELTPITPDTNSNYWKHLLLLALLFLVIEMSLIKFWK